MVMGENRPLAMAGNQTDINIIHWETLDKDRTCWEGTYWEVNWLWICEIIFETADLLQFSDDQTEIHFMNIWGVCVILKPLAVDEITKERN